MTAHDEAKPALWQSAVNPHAPWVECSEHVAARLSSDGYATRALYTATDYEALRAEVERLRARVAAMKDYKTHHHDWVRACEVALNTAVDAGDADYWRHQIETLAALNDQGQDNG